MKAKRVGFRVRVGSEVTPGARGFTLIELLLVITIIGVVAAIAIPGFLTARMAANESSAVGTLKTMATSIEQYHTRFGAYAGDFQNLFDADLLPFLKDGTPPEKAGYTFFYAPIGDSYRINADPSDPGRSGSRFFFIDQSGVIRFSYSGSADDTDVPLD